MDDIAVFPKYIAKPWGSETIFALNEMYAGKILKIKAGHRLSLQYHEKKHETMLLVKGLCKITLGERVIQFNPGECYAISPNTIHRVEAIHDSEIFEVSTPFLDDVIRISDDYHRVASD